MTSQSIAAAIASMPRERDARVDFFRGLALIFIFIDHVQDNVLHYATMQSFGFADAADVFVSLAGYASFLAYTRVFDGQGWGAGLVKVGKRIGTLYLAHILFLVACVAALVVAVLFLDNPIYQDIMDLEPFFNEPMRALRKALLLTHQPGNMDILPLYVVLLLWFPILLLLMRIHVVVALAASAALWLAANRLGWNLPTYPENEGWYFNPFAWQLLFSLGAIAAYFASRQALPGRSLWLTVPAIGIVLYALLAAAPWTAVPVLDEARLLPAPDALLGEQNKQLLSLWRVAQLAALAYLAASLVPASANWLNNPLAQRLIDCGRRSLPVFCLGVALSMAGTLAMAQHGDGWGSQIAVNTVGIALLLCTGWALARLAQRKAARRRVATRLA